MKEQTKHIEKEEEREGWIRTRILNMALFLLLYTYASRSVGVLLTRKTRVFL